MSLFGSKKKQQPTKPADQAVVQEQQSGGVVLQGTSSGAFRIMRGTHVSERASLLMGMNQYVFQVAGSATKPEIKKQIEKMYKVHVEKVRIVRLPGKTKQIGRNKGFRPGVKKAIVRLVKGDVIEQAKP